MARITVEDCIDKFPSRFELVLVASNRARKIHAGEDPTVEIDNDNKRALYEVIILGPDKKYFKFRWQVEKFLEDGPLKNCWLTTVVSQPIPMGSST